MIDEQQIYIKALRKWKDTSQIFMCIEEFSELIKELAKINRKKNGTSIKKIIEEIIDCEIMIGQMKVLLNYDSCKYYKIKQKKLERLSKMLGD